METSVTLTVIALALLVSWLGGGRKWAFRTMLSLLVLGVLVGCGVLLYGYWASKSAERRAQKLHECVVAKIATARCEQPPSTESSPVDLKPYEKKTVDKWEKYREKDVEIVPDICPPYMLPDNATVVQEAAALTAAEQACQVEMNPSEKPLQEQVSEYRRAHGIKEPAKSDVDYDVLAKKAGAIKSTLGTAACAAKVRKKYPGAYDDLGDATLTKKVLAKYPDYCNDNFGDRPGFEPVIEDIR
jgi:hypothetical protein